LFKHRALGRCRISRASFAPLGSGAHLAPALAGRLPANFNACAAQRGAAAGAGSRSPTRPHRQVTTRKKPSFQGFVRYAAITSLNTALDAACCASPE